MRFSILLPILRLSRIGQLMQYRRANTSEATYFFIPTDETAPSLP
jgi:hypothetical protein